MDKKRLKIALAVLDAIKGRFPQTQEFISSTLKEEWKRKDYCRWGNFLTV